MSMTATQPEPENTNSCWRGAKACRPVPTAVAHPCEATALSGAVEACKLGLIIPILVGPRDKIRETAKAAGIDLERASRSSTFRTATPRRRRRSNWSAKAGPRS